MFSKLKNSFSDKSDVLWIVASISFKTVLFTALISRPFALKPQIFSLASLLLVVSMIDFLPSQPKKWGLFFVNLLTSFIFLSDLIYFRYFRDVISVSVLYEIRQLPALLPIILKLFKLIDLLFFIDFIFWIPRFSFSRNQEKEKPPQKVSVVAISACLGILLAMGVQINIKDMLNKKEWSYFNEQIIDELGIINFHAFDAVRTLRSQVFKPHVTPQEWEDIHSWFDHHPARNEGGPLFGAAKGKNLMVVVEESLQEFVVGLKVDGQEITPNINHLVRESYYFPNFFDQTNEGRSSDSEFCSLVSLHPLSAGTVCYRFATNTFESLTKILKAQGMNSLYAYPFEGCFWNRNVMNKVFGFDQAYFIQDFKIDETIGWGLSDSHFFSQMFQKMSLAPPPFFAYLLTLSNHTPFDLPLEYRGLSLGIWEGSLIGNYLHSVHYADQALGEFVQKLKETGLYDQSVLVITGDHDGGLNEVEVAALKEVEGNELSLAQLDKVPFLIHLPGSTKGNSFKTIGGTLDMAPTLLHLFGIKSQNNYFMGSNLFAPREEKLTVFRNGSVVDEKNFFITTNGSFENGVCASLPDGKIVDKDECQGIFSEGQKRLEISDLIVHANLIPKLKNR